MEGDLAYATREIIVKNYSDIKKHPLEEELQALRKYQQDFATMSEIQELEISHLSSIIEILKKVNNITINISLMVINMLPKRGDMCKLDCYSDLISINPINGVGKIRYSHDLELIADKLELMKVNFFDNSLDIVNKEADKIMGLNITSKKKDYADEEIDNDKEIQIRAIKFKIHILEVIKSDVASFLNINLLPNQTFEYHYDDLEKVKLNFIKKLITDTLSLQMLDFKNKFNILKTEAFLKVSYLIKFIEANGDLLKDVLVSWKSEKSNKAGMYN